MTAGLESAKALAYASQAAGIPANIHILIADTEMDIPEVEQSCSQAGIDYLQMCNLSRENLAGQINMLEEELGSMIRVETFTSVFGDGFNQMQKELEQMYREQLQLDPKLDAFITKLSQQRAAKHAHILGRGEQDNELTIRYASQYNALRELLLAGNQNGSQLVVNYPTPNKLFLNPQQKFAKELAGSSTQVLPVLGSLFK